MNTDSKNATDLSDETGFADVRHVREKIAAKYNGDLRKHAAETDQIVQSLIGTLGLKQGAPTRDGDRGSRRTGSWPD